MLALRLSGKDERAAEKFWVGMSHFLPGGAAKFGATPAEKYYFVLDGEITVKTEREESTPGPWDSVYIAPNEARSILNKTNKPVSMLVAINY